MDGLLRSPNLACVLTAQFLVMVQECGATRLEAIAALNAALQLLPALPMSRVAPQGSPESVQI
jgi:hypothetical protein